MDIRFVASPRRRTPAICQHYQEIISDFKTYILCSLNLMQISRHFAVRSAYSKRQCKVPFIYLSFAGTQLRDYALCREFHANAYKIVYFAWRDCCLYKPISNVYFLFFCTLFCNKYFQCDLCILIIIDHRSTFSICNLFGQKLLSLKHTRPNVSGGVRYSCTILIGLLANLPMQQ